MPSQKNPICKFQLKLQLPGRATHPLAFQQFPITKASLLMIMTYLTNKGSISSWVPLISPTTTTASQGQPLVHTITTSLDNLSP